MAADSLDDDIPWYAPRHHRVDIPRQRQPGEEVWRLRDPSSGQVQSCELRDDSSAGGGWDVTMPQDDEPLFSRRCLSPFPAHRSLVNSQQCLVTANILRALTVNSLTAAPRVWSRFLQPSRSRRVSREPRNIGGGAAAQRAAAMSVKHHYAALPSKKWCPECDTTQPTAEFGETGRNKVCKRCNARRRPRAVPSPPLRFLLPSTI